MNNFWEKLPKPFLVLAPMEGVTDTVFRQVLVAAGKPHVMVSEFTGVEQLFSPAVEKIIQNLEYTQAEKPLVAQFWGVTPELFFQAGKLAMELGYDGVDINMGCPDRSILKKGGGSMLYKDKNLARELILATKEGLEDKLPVSVKIRLGFEKNDVENWASWLLETNIAALTIHGRTTVELSKVPANWDAIGRVKIVRDQMKKSTYIIGNGDVQSVEESYQKWQKYGVDGVMIGRGIFHNPWLFNKYPDAVRCKQDKLKLLLLHLDIWENTWMGEKSFDRLKRFFKIYLYGFNNAAEIRDKLMRSHNIMEVREIINDYLIK